jgi:hypothetical protein
MLDRSRLIRRWVVAALVISGVNEAHSLNAQGARVQEGSDSARMPRGVEILDAYLAERIGLLESKSPRLRAAMERARAAPFPVVIGTPEQMARRLGARRWLALQSGEGQLADFLIYKSDREAAAIELIVIRAHLKRIRAAPSAMAPLGIGRGRAQRWVDATVDALLIHELWGHLVPIVDAGNHTGNCPDPALGEPALESCVMRRENDMRLELGLAPRLEYRVLLR